MKPDDVSQEAWEQAQVVAKEATRDAMRDPLMPYYITVAPHIARAITAAVMAEREACAESGRAAVMKFRSKVGGRYYPGYHEDMREAVASAIRARSTP